MIQMAINVLWLLIGVICLCGVVWLALYIIKLFMPVPDIIDKMVWAIVLILILIGILTLLAGGGGSMRAPFHLSRVAGPTYTSGPYAPAINL